MKRTIVTLIVLIAVAAGVGAYYRSRRAPEPQVTTAPITRGDVVDVVAATGTLEAVETVDVGTQVSGILQELYADFNNIVKKGQVIAKLDPSLIQTQIEQQQANVTRSQADLERLHVNLADAKQKLDRAQAMWAKNLIPRTDLETAEVNVKLADAQIKSAEAALVQAQASLNNQKVNLQHTIITAPIDGIVISRNVDVGQTVQASMQAPTLYVLAADLTKMQVVANIDEADVGRMRPNQPVTFHVDAYPTETFTGTVTQVRLQPTVVQNVVTYSTVISVPNPDYKLKPGMTASVNVEIARRSNVLRIPTASLRFRPTEEMFQVLNQQMPPELQRGRGGLGTGRAGGGRNTQGQAPGQGGNPPSNAAAGTSAPGAQPGATTPGTSAPSGTPPNQPTPTNQQARGDRPGSPEGRGGGDRPGSGESGGSSGGRGFDPNMTTEERRKRMEERMANMSPEERERWMARRAEGGGRGGIGGNQDKQGGKQANARQDSNRGIAASIAPGALHDSGKSTIDELFGPLPQVETRGRAWLYMDKKLKPVNLWLGVSDSTYSELLSGDLKEGQEVVISMITGLEPRVTPGQQGGQNNNPLMGPQRGRGPGGGPGGGGGGRGR
jgi:HlyD family secretion protein